MKNFLLLFLALSLPNIAPAAGLDNLSYGQLAAKVIRPSWEKTNAAIEEVNQDTLPHEVKDTRKLIASLKEQLDLFAYAYPADSEDQWLEIRKNLDKGYEAFGEFKDLYDIQELEEGTEPDYDNKEVKAARKDLLRWIQKWQTNSQAYGDYVSRPDTRELHSRKKKLLSRFYWGSTKLEPDSGLKGTENLAALAAALRDAAISDWSGVKKVKNPADGTNEEEVFHDFRKRIRSLARILRAFPLIYAGEESILEELETLASNYGDLHDMIVAHEKAVTKGDEKKAKKLHKKVGDGWRELLRKQEERGVKSLLKAVRLS